MYKEIYNKENGDVELVKGNFDERKNEEVFDYDTKKFTDEQPSSDLYRPIYYDDKDEEWVGTDYKDWYDNYMNNQDNAEYNDVEYIPTELEKEMSMITKLLFNSQKEVEELQQDFANLVKELNNKGE